MFLFTGMLTSRWDWGQCIEAKAEAKTYAYEAEAKYNKAEAALLTQTSLSNLALLKFRMALPFWCYLTQVVLEKRRGY